MFPLQIVEGPVALAIIAAEKRLQRVLRRSFPPQEPLPLVVFAWVPENILLFIMEAILRRSGHFCDPDELYVS